MLHADSSAFGAGDVVGCGLLWASGHVFFTVNGEWKGFLLDAEVAAGCSLVPCAGLRSPTVLVFITGAKPFCCPAATLSSVAQASTKLDKMQGAPCRTFADCSLSILSFFPAHHSAMELHY